MPNRSEVNIRDGCSYRFDDDRASGNSRADEYWFNDLYHRVCNGEKDAGGPGPVNRIPRQRTAAHEPWWKSIGDTDQYLAKDRQAGSQKSNVQRAQPAHVLCPLNASKRTAERIAGSSRTKKRARPGGSASGSGED